MQIGPDDEVDPTGVRELLRSLPAPGPMPDAVASRIQAALEAERHDHETGTVLTLRAQRRPRWSAIGVAAAAVAVVAISGAVISRIGGDDTTGGAIAAPTPSGFSARTHVASSERDYTTDSLTVQAQELLATTDPTSPASTDSGDLGRIGTPEGLASCLASLGESDATRVTADLARFDGQPALIIVVEGHGSPRVYVVDQRCGEGTTEFLREPVPLG